MIVLWYTSVLVLYLSMCIMVVDKRNKQILFTINFQRLFLMIKFILVLGTQVYTKSNMINLIGKTRLLRTINARS